MAGKLRTDYSGVRAKGVRLVSSLHQFRPEMMVTWASIVVMEVVRSGWTLDVF